MVILSERSYQLLLKFITLIFHITDAVVEKFIFENFTGPFYDDVIYREDSCNINYYIL